MQRTAEWSTAAIIAELRNNFADLYAGICRLLGESAQERTVWTASKVLGKDGEQDNAGKPRRMSKKQRAAMAARLNAMAGF